MRYNGYVPIRRGLLEHLQQNKITPNEYIVFNVLLTLANSSTGGYTINVPTLLFWTGQQMKKKAAKTALELLHKKGYIFLDSRKGSNHARPYWINKYLITSGAKQDYVLIVENKDGNCVRSYVSVEAEGEAKVEAEGEATGEAKGYSNKKREIKNETGDRMSLLSSSNNGEENVKVKAISGSSAHGSKLDAEEVAVINIEEGAL